MFRALLTLGSMCLWIGAAAAVAQEPAQPDRVENDTITQEPADRAEDDAITQEPTQPDPSETDAVAQGPAQLDPAEAEGMMQAWMTPGDHHKATARMAGEWVLTGKFWPDPAQPPMETAGTARFDVVMNGLFVTQVTQMTMLGMPWEGRGTYGFDNQTKKHVSIWYDSFGSSILTLEGECEADCSTITVYSNAYRDPARGRDVRMKSVSHRADDDHMQVEMYVVDGASEVKLGEVGYTRKR